MLKALVEIYDRALRMIGLVRVSVLEIERQKTQEAEAEAEFHRSEGF